MIRSSVAKMVLAVSVSQKGDIRVAWIRVSWMAGRSLSSSIPSTGEQ